MAIREIVTVGESCLRKVCRPVTDFNAKLHRVLDDMAETLADANGAGLAAPQIGLLRRICLVLDEESEQYLELINPEIIAMSGEQTGLEGCLSVPGKWGIVTRPDFVRVRAQDRNGNWFEAEGYPPTPFPAILYSQLLMTPLSLPLLEAHGGHLL